MIELNFIPCYYCGLPANSVDHAIPQALKRSLADDLEAYALIVRRRVEQVPSCRECNCLLGSSVQETLCERKALLKEKLRRRYAKFIRMPDWTTEELAGLRPSLRRRVAFGVRKKQVVLARLRW